MTEFLSEKFYRTLDFRSWGFKQNEKDFLFAKENSMQEDALRRLLKVTKVQRGEGSINQDVNLFW